MQFPDWVEIPPGFFDGPINSLIQRPECEKFTYETYDFFALDFTLFATKHV